MNQKGEFSMFEQVALGILAAALFALVFWVFITKVLA